MITFYKIPGRLGNNMLSFYTTYYYCMINNIDYKKIYFTPNCFTDGIKLYNNNILYTNFLDRFIQEDVFLQKLKSCNNIIYDGNYHGSDDIYFCGCYWKVPDMGTEYERQLFKKLFYNKQLFKQLEQKYSNIDFKNRLGIHIRRTDFINIQPESVEDILSRINKKYNKYVVFSDDIQWCKNNIHLTDCIFMEGNEPYEDLILLSMCDDITGTKYSTFSGMARRLKQSINDNYAYKDCVERNLYILDINSNNSYKKNIELYKIYNPHFNIQLIQYSLDDIQKICNIPEGKMEKPYKYDFDWILNYIYYYTCREKNKQIDFNDKDFIINYKYCLLNQFGGIVVDSNTIPIRTFDCYLMKYDRFKCTCMTNTNACDESQFYFMGLKKNKSDGKYINLYPNIDKIDIKTYKYNLYDKGPIYVSQI